MSQKDKGVAISWDTTLTCCKKPNLLNFTSNPIPPPFFNILNEPLLAQEQTMPHLKALILSFMKQERLGRGIIMVAPHSIYIFRILLCKFYNNTFTLADFEYYIDLVLNLQSFLPTTYRAGGTGGLMPLPDFTSQEFYKDVSTIVYKSKQCLYLVLNTQETCHFY